MTFDLRFPIGRFDADAFDDTATNIQTISDLPNELNLALQDRTELHLDTPYRPEGWTVRQTVHHIADSHANSLIRFKLALTEDEPPIIKPYFEDRWAELSDNKLPVEVSLKMIDSIHTRWAALLNSMSDGDFNRKFIHPETGEWTLAAALALYAWHSKHHTAHITCLRDRMGW
ncbi:bacillithiol transferase BstA [soil metagenome]